jgi:hypothetical protein
VRVIQKRNFETVSQMGSCSSFDQDEDALAKRTADDRFYLDK